MTESRGAHAALMDRVYRRQRYIYDLTRRYYLFGRDKLIRELALKPGEAVVEVGCGTARNLIRIARTLSGGRAVRSRRLRKRCCVPPRKTSPPPD